MSKRIIKDYKAEVKYLKDWIVDYFCLNGNDETCAVVGISGGKDSTIVAYLCAAALGPERVIGVKMPNGEQYDIACADRVISELGIEDYQINIKNIVDAITSELEVPFDELSTSVTYNIPPRVRMTVLYAVAAALGGRVANTSNYSERYVGWSTKWGDGVGDFAPLADYTVEEVLNIGKELGVPYDLLYKTPEDGLTHLSDEQALGVEYTLIDQYIRCKEKPDDYEACRIIYDRNKLAQHKMTSQRIPHPYARIQWDDVNENEEWF